MLDVLNFLKKKDKPANIKHVAISVKDVIGWAKKNEKPFEDAFLRRNTIINDIVELMVKKNIPIVTIYLLSENDEKTEHHDITVESLTEFFSQLKEEQVVNKNQIRISVLGKWYSLPGMVVESIKQMIDKTKEYDNFFLNFCVNYDGREEITDAFNLIHKEIKDLGIENQPKLNKDLIKENTYSSYFIPPELIIETGKDHKFSGVLLWDSVDAKIFFIEKMFPEIKKDDFESIIDKN
jgi:tritrans,polycis-undecaprenyl-diphosphate synthase [geranylgeranyl-diphosphate specific]